ncbi:MAG: c-type cytochrome [Chloroflexota bacterium]
MTDQTGRPSEERLPASRPSSAPAPAERFSAPPSAHRADLTPERAARIVRQSANARLVGFLAVTLVGLFVIGYYFYELGLPGGLTTPRLTVALEGQQVTEVERGYTLFQANCAQCHGANGEGGKGPVLNRQDKLFAHLSPEYIRTMLQAGGRFACGNAKSIMPVWSNTGNPAGPLNYKQLDYLVAFLRAPNTQTFRVLDPALAEPVIDPVTKKEKTFTGWWDPNYKPEPGATPYPACWSDEFNAPAASSAAPSASAGGSAAPSASAAPAVTVVKEAALNVAFTVPELSVPADAPFSIEFDNQDAGMPHNIQIKGADGGILFDGDLVNGPGTVTYNVPALPAGTYTFVCKVHPNMTGTLKVGS